MNDNTLTRIFDFIKNTYEFYIDDIRGDKTTSFTRKTKVEPVTLMLQMFTQKGQTQYSELVDFYKEINTPLIFRQSDFIKLE